MSRLSRKSREAGQLELRVFAPVPVAPPAEPAAAVRGRAGDRIFLYCAEKDFARAAGQVLREIYGDDWPAALRLAEDGVVDNKTARNWIAGANGPRGLQLCRLVRATADHGDLIARIERAIERDLGFDRATGEAIAELREAAR